jgi:hypothetical protein
MRPLWTTIKHRRRYIPSIEELLGPHRKLSLKGGLHTNSALGLSVHMNQVHKENLTHVENANPGRQGLEIEIFGMEGVPAEIIDQHNQQVTQAHFAEEQERARITGNPVRGLYVNGQAPATKRPKINESLDEIEQRADKFRTDRKNGVIMPPVAEPVQNPVSMHFVPRTLEKLTHP